MFCSGFLGTKISEKQGKKLIDSPNKNKLPFKAELIITKSPPNKIHKWDMKQKVIKLPDREVTRRQELNTKLSNQRKQEGSWDYEDGWDTRSREGQ